MPTIESPEPGARAFAEPSLTGEVMRAVVDAAPDALLIIDDVGRVQLVNSRAESLFGYHRGELLGREIEMLIPGRYRGAHAAHRLRYRAEPQIRAMGSGLLLHALRSDGSEVPVEISLSPLSTTDGMRVIATVRDISDRAAAESHARLIRHTIDAVSTDAVLIFEVDSLRFTYVNDGATKLLGYSKPDLLGGMTPLHVAPDLDDQRMRTIVASLDAGSQTAGRFGGLILREDGRNVPVEWAVERPTMEDGSRRLLVAIVRDVSERVAVERSLIASEDAFRIAFEQAPTGIALADISQASERPILRTNASFARMLGYEPGELVGRSFAELSHPDDATLDADMTQRLANGSLAVYHREKRYRHALGHYIWAELYANVLDRGDGSLTRTLAHITDITTRKEVEVERDRQSRFVNALGDLSKTLLASAALSETTTSITRGTRALLDADWAVLATIDELSNLRQIVSADGPGAAAIVGSQHQSGQTMSDAVADALGTTVGPATWAPVQLSAKSLGTLLVMRRPDRDGFDERDTQLLASYASQVSIALELAAARADRQRVALLEDRERIARDLHDHVIQQLFAAGMSLQATAGRTKDSLIAERVLSAVDTIDDTISQIRTTIFQLSTRTDDGLRDQVVRLVHTRRDALGFEPRVSFVGPVDGLSEFVTDDLLGVLNEALANVSRHARATTVDVTIERVSDRVELRVIDDGMGVCDADPTGNGRTNMIERAEALGGWASIDRGITGGTVVTWSIPTCN